MEVGSNQGQLFALESDVQPLEQGERTVSVLVDQSGVEQEFCYICPQRWAGQVRVGSLVRFVFNGRRREGWVTALDPAPPEGVGLRFLDAVLVGPSAEVVALARWVAKRWLGPMRVVLRSASPSKVVKVEPRPRPLTQPEIAAELLSTVPAEVSTCWDQPGVILYRCSPARDFLPLVLSAAGQGNLLVLVPTLSAARRLVSRLRSHLARVHLLGSDWVGAMSGGVVVGTRSAVFASMPAVDAIVVLDEHDDGLRQQRVPTWHGRDVAIERARRNGVTVLLVSATPSIAALTAADRVVVDSRAEMRRGWPLIELVDQRQQDPSRGGLFPARTVKALRQAEFGVVVLNRKGRAVMLACGSCGELVRSEDGEHLMVEVDGELVAPNGERRPLICGVCGATGLKRLRLGVSRAAEELEAMLGRPVMTMTADTKSPGFVGGAGLVLGTSAVLYGLERADVVVFLDFDQELMGSGYLSGQAAMAALGAAGRLCAANGVGRIIVQTRNPNHRVIRAGFGSDVGLFLDEELALREAALLPPFSVLVEVSGDEVEGFIGVISETVNGLGVDVLGPRDGRYLLRCSDWQQLADLFAAVDKPWPKVRLAVDPPGV